MAFETERVDAIIAGLSSASVEEKLKAIEEAQDLNKNIFSGELSPSEWAYRAMVIENQYNLIRDILKENFKKLNPAELSASVSEEKKPKAAPKKKLPPTKDPAFLAMMAEVLRPKENPNV